jgi:hypothetical protein
MSIIELARQAGFFIKDSEAYSPSVQEDHELTPCLKAFAKLVAEKERERMTVVAMDAAEKAVDVAIKLEREACALVADEAIDFWVKRSYPESAEVREAQNIAESIRARGQA